MTAQQITARIDQWLAIRDALEQGIAKAKSLPGPHASDPVHRVVRRDALGELVKLLETAKKQLDQLVTAQAGADRGHQEQPEPPKPAIERNPWGPDAAAENP